MLLQKLEEVLDFEAAILRHVCAVNGVSNSVLAKFSSKQNKCKMIRIVRYNSEYLPEGVGAQVSSDLGIVGTTELSEGGHSVLLADFKGDNGTSGKVLDDGEVLREHTLIHIHEFLNNRTVQVEELHAADLETSLKDHVKNLTSLAFTLDVRLDEAECAVVEDGGGLHGSLSGLLTSEPVIVLTLVRADAITSVNGILSAISAKKGAQGLRSLSTCILCVGRTNEAAPGSDSIDADKLHSDDDIASNELLQVGEERLSLVLSVELLSCITVKAGHLQLVDLETTALDSTDDGAHLSVAVRLDHSESALARSFEIAAGMDITVVHDTEHAREDSDVGSNVEVFKGHGRSFLALQELASVLDIKHLDGLQTRVVEEAVWSDDISLLVVPFRFKSILLLGKGRCLLHNELEDSLKQFLII